MGKASIPSVLIFRVTLCLQVRGLQTEGRAGTANLLASSFAGAKCWVSWFLSSDCPSPCDAGHSCHTLRSAVGQEPHILFQKAADPLGAGHPRASRSMFLLPRVGLDCSVGRAEVGCPLSIRLLAGSSSPHLTNNHYVLRERNLGKSISNALASPPGTTLDSGC